jgi:hypothetical protein
LEDASIISLRPHSTKGEARVADGLYPKRRGGGGNIKICLMVVVLCIPYRIWPEKS